MSFGAAAARVKVLIMPSIATNATQAVGMRINNGTTSSANLAAFWDEIDVSHTPQGYETVKLAASADTTEQTILDITGVGVLTHVVAPELSGSGIMTIRVTADGVVTTYVSETLATFSRFCIGDLRPGLIPNGTAANGVDYGGTSDQGYSGIGALLLTPLQTIVEALIGIKFETSLEVTIQGSVNIIGGAFRLNACANYTLFIPKGL